MISEELKVGDTVRITDLDEIYDTLIVLSDFSEDGKFGVIKYIGEQSQEGSDIIRSLASVCVVYNDSDEYNGMYSYDE